MHSHSLTKGCCNWHRFTRSYSANHWRRAVKERDGHKCLDCGTTDDLTVHHIFKKELYPHLALETDNGATLCTPCHRAIEGREEAVAERYAAMIGSTMRPLTLYGRLVWAWAKSVS